jgi:GNAT superfamily N-acetyltransferase
MNQAVDFGAAQASGHLKRFSNREAQERWSGPLTTRSGLKIFVRPARSGDRALLERFFGSLTREDLYFRFLSSIRRIDGERLEAMLCDSDDHSIDFVALDVDTGEILATAMLAADRAFETAEFALCTRPDARGKGISWSLLDLAARYAQAMGVKRLQSLQSAGQNDALQLEREMGFTVRTCPDDRTLMLAEKTF